MSDDEKILLGELKGSVNELLRLHNADREERGAWRDGIEKKVDDLAEQMRPVVRDHQIVVGVVSWATKASVVVGGIFGAVKGWLWFTSDRLRP